VIGEVREERRRLARAETGDHLIAASGADLPEEFDPPDLAQGASRVRIRYQLSERGAPAKSSVTAT
jgi:hypothetical protein